MARSRCLALLQRKRELDAGWPLWASRHQQGQSHTAEKQLCIQDSAGPDMLCRLDAYVARADCSLHFHAPLNCWGKWATRRAPCSAHLGHADSLDKYPVSQWCHLHTTRFVFSPACSDKRQMVSACICRRHHSSVNAPCACSRTIQPLQNPIMGPGALMHTGVPCLGPCLQGSSCSSPVAWLNSPCGLNQRNAGMLSVPL